MDRINELVKILKKASDIYYNTSRKILSDSEYDELKDELRKLDPTNKYLSEVGYKVKGNKIKLPYISGSLNKIKDIDKWTRTYKGPYVISDKLDGTSGILEIKNKKYILYKRGDGIYGSEISELIEYLRLPNIKLLDNMVIRGELMISRNDFNKIDMANARSAVNGLVNSKIINKSVAKITHFIAHSIQYPYMTACKQIDKLVELGFETPYAVIQDNLSNLEDLLNKRRIISSYDIDGLVISDCSDIYMPNELYPSHSFAFKTINEILDAKVENVIWTASKDKYLKPVITINPIIIGGVTITNVTAFNAKFVIDNGIGRGAIVQITRGGDVIPHILSVKKSVKPDLPSVPYAWNSTGVDLISEEDNIESLTAKILYFFKTIGVKNLGDKIINKFIEYGYDDIFKILNAKKSDILQINGIGEKLINKIFINIKDSLYEIERHKLMAASGIFGRGFGIKKLELINSNINNNNIEELYDVITNLKGFSESTAQKFTDNYADYIEFENKIKSIYDINFIKKNKYRIVVFTGFRDAELKKYAENYGDKIVDNLTKLTDLLVYSNNTSKLDRAKQLGIKTMSVDEYKKYLNYKT